MLIQTEDEAGQDSKIVAIPTSKIDPSFSTVQDIEDVPQHLKDQIKHFFEHYKELEKGKFVKISGWEGKEYAVRKITDAISSLSKSKRELKSLKLLTPSNICSNHVHAYTGFSHFQNFLKIQFRDGPSICIDI